MKHAAGRILMSLGMLAIIAGILLLCVACQPSDRYKDPSSWYSYECEFDKVEGTFLTSRSQARGSYKMITVYRVRDGRERTFAFPREKIEVCRERD